MKHWLLLISILLLACGEPNKLEGDQGVRDSGLGLDAFPTDAETIPDTGMQPAPEDVPSKFLREERRDNSPMLAGDSAFACVEYDDTTNEFQKFCTDSQCDTSGACCVGNVDCCVPQTSITFDFQDCDSGQCLNGATVFGNATDISGAGFRGAGSVNMDSGLLIAQVDPSSEKLSVVLSVDQASGCVDCIDSLSLSVTRQDNEALAATNEVAVQVGVVISASRQTAALTTNGELRGVLDLSESTSGDLTFSLTPDGSAFLSFEGGTPIEIGFAPQPNSRLVLHGRAQNPEAIAERLTLRKMTIDKELCDIPTAWTNRQQVVFAQSDLVNSPGAPTVALEESTGDTWVAFEDGGQILVARRNGAPNELSIAPTPLLGLANFTDAEVNFADPELVRNGEGWFLYVTDLLTNSIVRVAFDSLKQDTPPQLELEEVLTLDTASRAGTTVVELGSPTVLKDTQLDALLVVKAVFDDGTQSFLSYEETPEGEWKYINSELRQVVFANTTEVNDPSLIYYRGAYQLYYATKVGTRWQQGLLVSDEMYRWLLAEDSALMAAEVGSDGFGVRGLDLIKQQGDFGVEAFYLGLDASNGVGTLHHAVRNTGLDSPDRSQ